MSGTYFHPIKRVFLNLSGGTVTGDTIFTQGVYANELSGGTYYSGSTLLDIIITNIAASVVASSASTLATRVQPGSNIATGGTALFPIVSVVDSPSFNGIYFSGTAIGNALSATSLSAGTFYSGGTDLYDIFSTITGSGNTYTPVLTNISNIFSSATFISQYIVYENTCTVSGKISVDPIDVAVSTKIGISLPIFSNFTSEEQCAGTAFSYNIAVQGGAILADSVNNRAELRFISTDLSSQDMSFSFTYKIN